MTVTVDRQWDSVKLGTIAEFRNGINYNKNNFGYGIKVINVKDFQDHSIASLEGLDEVNPTGIIKEKDLLKNGDIIFVRSNGNRELIGRSLFIQGIQKPVTHSAFTIKLRFTSNLVLSRFYAYLFRTSFVRQMFSAHGNGTNISNLNQGILTHLQVPVPPLSTQQKIVSILSNYDRLIENNTRRIEILEEMARSLYDEWFVKFRFPGYEQTKMVDSELGMIPEDWKVIELGQLLDIKHGYAFKGQYFSKDPTLDILLTPANFAIGGGFQDDKLKYYNGTIPDDFVLDTEDLVITMTDLSKAGDTLGYPAFVPPSKSFRFLHNQRLGKVIIHEQKLAGKTYLYYTFCSELYRHHILATATGSTVKHTAPDRIKSFKLPLPCRETSKRFEEITTLFCKEVTYLSQKNSNLRQTRDLLLPKLISGEIDVENLDIETEVAA